MAEESKTNKRINRMVVEEISLVKNPANEEDEWLMLKSMDAKDEVIRKAAEVHKALMAERLEALKKLSDEIIANAMTLDTEELNSKLYQLSDVSWSIRDVANTVNIAKSGGIEMSDQNTTTPESIADVQKRLDEIATLVTNIGKAKGKGKDTDTSKQVPKFKCPKCGFEGVPAAGGKCPECGAAMEQIEKADDKKDSKEEKTQLKKLQDMVGALGTHLETIIGKNTDAAVDDDEVSKGVKQLSKDRQAKLIESLKPVVELLQEVDPDFDLMAAISPPKPTEVEKAVTDSEVRIKDAVAKAIADNLAPLQKKVDELAGTQGDSRATDAGDAGDDTKTQKSGDSENVWNGDILGSR